MRIGDHILKEIVSQVNDHMTAYQEALSDAFVHCGDSLNVSFGVKVKPEKNGRMEVETSISFTKEKITDKITAVIDDEQMGMFGEDEE